MSRSSGVRSVWSILF